MSIALVSCVKTKRAHPAPARDLYISPLFRGLRAYAEQHADRWFILSAEHGVIAPAEMIAPYEKTLITMRTAERTAWAVRVRSQLIPILPPGADVILLAGMLYRQGIERFLIERGHHVWVPLRGLSIGRQLAVLRGIS